MHRTPQGPGPWLGFLAFVLVVWQPVSFAMAASAALERLVSYGAPALLLLTLRVGVTGLGIAAGRALWAQRPDARRLTLWCLALASAATVLTLVTPYFPSNRTPGGKRLAAAAVLAHNAAWAIVVSRSRRLDEPPPAPGGARVTR